MSRTEAGLKRALNEIAQIRHDFWHDLAVTGSNDELNPELEKALRLADFIELGALMCTDALQRNESCGAHFREEFQTEDGKASRNDDEYAYVSAWEYNGGDFRLHREPLVFEAVAPTARSYK